MSMIINCVRDEPGSHITMCTGRWRMDHSTDHVCNDRCLNSKSPMIPTPRFEQITTLLRQGYGCFIFVFRICNVQCLCVDIVYISLEWCSVCWYVYFFVAECSLFYVFNVTYSVL